MTDPAPSPNFLWWGATLVLEVTAAALLWRATGRLHWHPMIRFTAVWFGGAAVALGMLAAWVYVNELFKGAAKSLPVARTRTPSE